MFDKEDGKPSGMRESIYIIWNFPGPCESGTRLAVICES